MKESAYKIYIRQFGGRFFAPQKLSCSIISDTEGSIEINNNDYISISTITKDFVYSVSKTKDAACNTITNCCFKIPEVGCNTQQYIYQKIIERFNSRQNNRNHETQILKNKFGVPFLYCSFSKTETPLSISHHGQYAAFTIN